jgi:hypothetical protein
MWDQVLREGPGIGLPMYGGTMREPTASSLAREE